MNYLPNNQRGLSLIELLIAMVLGLLLTAGALQMMLTSQSIYRTTDTLSRIQENGRFSLNFITKSIRMAGYNSSSNSTTNGKVFWDGACGTTNPCTFNGTGSASDQIGVLLDPTNNRDCLGTVVAEDAVIVNVYYVDVPDPDNSDISSLYCRGYNPVTNTWLSSAQPLVDGVESLQALYGISDPSASNAITRYVSADAVTNWAEIGAVRVALLVNSGQENGNGDKRSRSFNLLDAPTVTTSDKHDRQAFSTTVVINNIIYQSRDSNL